MLVGSGGGGRDKTVPNIYEWVAVHGWNIPSLDGVTFSGETAVIRYMVAAIRVPSTIHE